MEGEIKRFGLKPSRRKNQVVAQLLMLTASHRRVSDEELEKTMSRGSKRVRWGQNMDALDRLLEDENK